MSQPHELYDRWQRAGAGRGRRASAPARFRPVGYRAGGPVPPGPLGQRPAGDTTQGPAPGGPTSTPDGGGVDLGAAVSAALRDLTGIGQVLLGVLLLATAALLLLSTTSAGGQLAGQVRRAATGPAGLLVGKGR